MPSMAHRALLLAICLAAAHAQAFPPRHMSHASARAGGVMPTPVRGDYVGTTLYVGDTCTNSLTCSPKACVKGTNTACSVSNNLGTTSNKSNTLLAATLASVQSRTCTVSSDARCTTAALTAVFGHYPGILAVYCNDGYLVMHTSGLAAHPSSLSSIYTPPGGGTCLSGASSCGYLDQCVTRDYASAYAVYKWPLAPVLLATASGTVNNAQMTFTIPQSSTSAGKLDVNNLLYFNGLTSMPTRGPVAVSVSGQNMFPVTNNNGGLTFPSCETDICNAHAGQGFDLHYHGDPYGPQCLYSCANYSSVTAHPPLIGYGLDGIPLFGRHLSANAVGASVALDDCGGHVHAGVIDTFITANSYHYHAFVSNITSMNAAAYAYQAYLYGPFMCWKGNISAIPNFFESNANPTGRTDYTSGQIQPCTGSGTTSMYIAPGFTLNGVTGTGFNYSGKVYTVGAGSTGGACTAAVSPPPSPPLPPPPKPPSPPPPTTSYSVSSSMLVTGARPPPPPVGASTPAVARTCTVGTTVQCTTNSSAAVSRTLSYNTRTGKFSGTMTTNSCPSIVTSFTGATGTCSQIYFPAPAYSMVTSSGVAAPITGVVAYTLSGMNIYNALENGFSAGVGPTICSTSNYACAAGTDVTTCIGELYSTCGAAQKTAVDTAIATSIFGDTCSGHASPYHFHVDPKCEYSPSSLAAANTVTAHSPLVAIALDGRGIYGAWESAGTKPTLDACGGHVGVVPATASSTTGGVLSSSTAGISGLASTSAYHYHFQSAYPYTLGCYSSAALSYSACTALYPGCKSFRPTVMANGSKFFYDDWCPCGTTIAGSTGQPISAIGAIPTVSGATCYASGAGISAPTTSAQVSTTVACTTSLLTSATFTAVAGNGRRRRHLSQAQYMSDISSPVADTTTASETGQGQPCDGWCAPPGFMENFPHTVSRYLGLTAQQEGQVFIDRVFSVQIPNVHPATYSSVQLWYYLPSSNSSQSAQFTSILAKLPSNAAFMADLATIFPGAQAVSIGTTTALVGSSADPAALMPSGASPLRGAFALCCMLALTLVPLLAL